MKKAKVSPLQSTEDEIEMMEGGTTAGDPDKLFNDFRADVKRRIEEYQSSKTQDEESEFNTTDELDGGAFFFRQANACDKCYLAWAITSSICFGLGMPGFSLLFGEMINGLGEATDGEYDTF